MIQTLDLYSHKTLSANRLLLRGGIPLDAMHKKAPASSFTTDRKLNVDPSVKRKVYFRHHLTPLLKNTEKSFPKTRFVKSNLVEITKASKSCHLGFNDGEIP